MSEASSKCRLCGSARTQDLGEIPESDYFAGRVLSTAIPGGRLILCHACESMFRHPVLSSSDYLALYRSGAPDQWSGRETRQDLRIIRSLLVACTGNLTILDLGCGRGDFLKSLPAKFLKYGIEPSSAAKQAVQEGVEILAPEIDRLPLNLQFDVITVIDVIEHVTDPGVLLTAAFAHVAPGGKIILSTGNPRCAWWRRVFKSRFWYSSFPEHVSFPSLRYCRLWCEANGARLGEVHSIRHQSVSLWRASWSLAAQLVFFISPRLFNWVGRAAVLGTKPRRQTFSPGIPGVFSDHQIVAIEKPPL